MISNTSDILDTSLLQFNDTDGSVTHWTIRDSVEGLQIFGGIGSGKTSGSGKAIALKYLSAGYGGLVLTAKAEEKGLWMGYAKATGREADMIILQPKGDYFFNFLDYESKQKDGEQTTTTNIVQVLKTVIRASDDISGGKIDDPFWENALDLLLYNSIDLCLIAHGTVTVQLLYDIVQSIPKKGNAKAEDEPLKAFDLAFQKAQANVIKQIDAWEAGYGEIVQTMYQSWGSKEEVLIAQITDMRTLKMVDEFFAETYWGLSEKTRSVIDLSFSSFLFRLMKDPVFSLLCRHPSNVTPEQSLEGKIILINLPVKKFNKVGRDSQILFKYIWQRAMEKRNVEQNGRPVFLWADEAQNFLHEYDAEYQATARSSRIATVYISQNLPNYYANMGGNKPEFRVKSFLGTLATKIFHANADIETRQYGSDLIGEAYEIEESESTAHSDGKATVTQTVTTKLAKMVRPEEFTSLKTGGPLNDWCVQAYVVLQSKCFKTGFSHNKITFKQ